MDEATGHSKAAPEALNPKNPAAVASVGWEAGKAVRHALRSLHPNSDPISPKKASLARWRKKEAIIRGQQFIRPVGGKPRLRAAGPAFSLAHTGSLALIGVAGSQAIGVDLEEARTVGMSQRRREEILAVGAGFAGGPVGDASSEVAVLQAWCRLEACAKARGQGCLSPIDRARPPRSPWPAACARCHRGRRATARARGRLGGRRFEVASGSPRGRRLCGLACRSAAAPLSSRPCCARATTPVDARRTQTLTCGSVASGGRARLR